MPQEDRKTRKLSSPGTAQTVLALEKTAKPCPVCTRYFTAVGTVADNSSEEEYVELKLRDRYLYENDIWKVSKIIKLYYSISGYRRYLYMKEVTGIPGSAFQAFHLLLPHRDACV